MSTTTGPVSPPSAPQNDNQSSSDKAAPPNEFTETDIQVRELLNTYFDFLDDDITAGDITTKFEDSF